MFKEEYTKFYSHISPSEQLLQDTIVKANKLENKSNNKFFLITKPAIIIASTGIFISLSMPVLAKTVEPIYNLMYMVTPSIAQFFTPVQKSCEDNGILMEVVSAYVHDNVAEIYITMQDLTGERIDENTDLYDSYSIDQAFDSVNFCRRIGFDPDTKTVTFLITIEQWGNKNIVGDKITFSVREFLSNKQRYDDIEIPISLSNIEIAKETQDINDIAYHTGGYGDYDKFRENPITLIPTEPISEFPVDGIDLTGIGYIDGKLHILTTIVDKLSNDNHGYFYLKDSQDNIVDIAYVGYFVNHYEKVDRINYSAYVFDIPQSEISDYTLHGSFVTSSMLTTGNWKVTFPLEKFDQ